MDFARGSCAHAAARRGRVGLAPALGSRQALDNFRIADHPSRWSDLVKATAFSGVIKAECLGRPGHCFLANVSDKGCAAAELGRRRGERFFSIYSYSTTQCVMDRARSPG